MTYLQPFPTNVIKRRKGKL